MRIEILNVRTGRHQQLSIGSEQTTIEGLGWSPDGKYLAAGIVAGQRSQLGINVVNLWSRRWKTLTRGPGDIAPSWSPNGRVIAYTRLDGDRRDLWVVNVRTGQGGQIARQAGDPTWRPDGRRVAFDTTSGTAGANCYEAGCLRNRDIVIADARGQNRVRMTADLDDEAEPSWSPDGKRIAFIRRSGEGSSQLMVSRPDGTGLEALSDGTTLDAQPAWRPGTHP